MAAGLSRRAQVLVGGGLAGVVAGLFVAWLWRLGAARVVACSARDEICLTPDNALAVVLGAPVSGLAAGVTLAAAGVLPARVAAGGAVVAVLTAMICGAIEYATPVTAGAVRLPPAWVPVLAQAALFTAVAWAATARTRRSLLLAPLAPVTAAVLIAAVASGPLQARENRAAITAARIPLLGVDLPGYQIAVAAVATRDPAEFGASTSEPPHLYLTMIPVGTTAGQTMAADLPYLSVDISRVTSRPWPPCRTDANGPCAQQRPGLWTRQRPATQDIDIYLRRGAVLVHLDGHRIPLATLVRAAGSLHPEPADIYAHTTVP